MQYIQVTVTEEVRLYTDMTAEHIFLMMITFPANPLYQDLSPEQLRQLKAAYMPEAVAMAETMRTESDNIALCYTMQWAVAVA